MTPSELQELIYKLIGLSDKVDKLDDRLRVVEDATINHESRLQELEEAEDE